MSGEKVWTSESPRRKNDPLDPAVVRAICQIWASHNSGQSWAEIGKERSMGGEVEIAFNKLLDQGLEAGQEELWSVYDAYNFHYPKCDDCDGPRPEVIIGTRAPG